MSIFIVPTPSVGMQPRTLRIPLPLQYGPQDGQDGVPAETVGTLRKRRPA